MYNGGVRVWDAVGVVGCWGVTEVEECGDGCGGALLP